jgi:zinc/manganese transport system substrate-binding protein
MTYKTVSLLFGLIGGVAALPVARTAPPVKVVTSLTTYAAIAREIVGDRGQVNAIATGDENPHYVQPRPSFVPLLARADVFVTTGLDLELWVPALLDKAANPKVTEGGPGYVAAYTGIDLLDIPASYSRSQGDIHVYGNPHIWSAPRNGVQIARNILTALKRVSPENADYFTARELAFEDRVFRALYGNELVTILGGQALADLDRQGKLFDFLNERRYKGAPLADRLGGWLKQGLIFRGSEMACYHKEWDYFSREFGIPCVGYIEPKPGIPPTPRHVRELIEQMRQRRVRVLMSPGYFDHSHIRQVAERTGAKAVIVPSNVGGAEGVNTYFDLINTLVGSLAQAYTESASTGR